jgi:hypothetical protein
MNAATQTAEFAGHDEKIERLGRGERQSAWGAIALLKAKINETSDELARIKAAEEIKCHENEVEYEEHWFWRWWSWGTIVFAYAYFGAHYIYALLR